MKRRNFMLLAGGSALAACSSWGIKYDSPAGYGQNWRVSNININIPSNLKLTTQGNRIAPSGDLGWWENTHIPPVDSIKSIMTNAANRATSGMRGSQAVTLQITLMRFHGLTPRARRTLTRSGVHNVIFSVQVFDAATGAPLTQPSVIHADTPAALGNQYTTNASRGVTETVRVTETIRRAIASWIGATSDQRAAFSRLGM